MSGNCVQRMCTFRKALFLVLTLSIIVVVRAEAANAPPLASARMSADRQTQYSDLAMRWMQDYLRIDTTNPPGNELRAATFFKRSSTRRALKIASSSTSRGGPNCGRAFLTPGVRGGAPSSC
jgi:hypothetical protein